jgi:hypothetical protein
MQTDCNQSSPSLVLSARTTFVAMSIVGVVLALMGFGAEYTATLENKDLLWAFARQFDFGQEGNFINWYQSVTLFGCALLAGTITFLNKHAGRPRTALWALIAVVMAFVAVDEAAQIHERTLNAVIAALTGEESSAKGGEDGAFGSSKWMFVYVPVALALSALYFRFFLALPKRTRWGFVIAATLYIGGAVGVELLFEQFSADGGGDTLGSFALDAASELGEMLGVAVFSGTLVAYLAREFSGLRVQFRSKV